MALQLSEYLRETDSDEMDAIWDEDQLMFELWPRGSASIGASQPSNNLGGGIFLRPFLSHGSPMISRTEKRRTMCTSTHGGEFVGATHPSNTFINMSEAVKTILQGEIKAAFALFDQVGDGTIENKDFGTLMRSLGYDLGEEAASAIAQKLDERQEGYIRFAEFRAYFINKLNSKDMRQDFRMAFQVMDVDKDKLISFQDLKSFLQMAGQKRTDEEINEMISDADLDGDGFISFEEFSRVMAIR